jgi:hypothetical protein
VDGGTDDRACRARLASGRRDDANIAARHIDVDDGAVTGRSFEERRRGFPS